MSGSLSNMNPRDASASKKRNYPPYYGGSADQWSGCRTMGSPPPVGRTTVPANCHTLCPTPYLRLIWPIRVTKNLTNAHCQLVATSFSLLWDDQIHQPLISDWHLTQKDWQKWSIAFLAEQWEWSGVMLPVILWPPWQKLYMTNSHFHTHKHHMLQDILARFNYSFKPFICVLETVATKNRLS